MALLIDRSWVMIHKKGTFWGEGWGQKVTSLYEGDATIRHRNVKKSINPASKQRGTIYPFLDVFP